MAGSVALFFFFKLGSNSFDRNRISTIISFLNSYCHFLNLVAFHLGSEEDMACFLLVYFL